MLALGVRTWLAHGVLRSLDGGFENMETIKSPYITQTQLKANLASLANLLNRRLPHIKETVTDTQLHEFNALLNLVQHALIDLTSRL